MANFLGVALDAVTYRDVFSAVDHWVTDKEGRSHHIACINAYCVTLAVDNPRLAKIYSGADIAGPDGMPFVRWIRLFGGKPCDRIAAPDLILALGEHAKLKNYTFFLYGGHPEVLDKMRANLEAWFPHLRILGHYSPPFRPISSEEDDAIVAKINALRPDIILVGLGTPKQDYWIEDHIYRIKGSVMIASGAAFDFFGGRIKMAPKWVRESGFEWLYRLFSKDFFRLWHRYTVMNIRFVCLFSLQVLRLYVRPPARYERPAEEVRTAG